MMIKYLLTISLFMPLVLLAQTSGTTENLEVPGNIYLKNLRNATGAGSSVSFSSFGNSDPGPRIRSYLDFASGTDSQSRLILSSYSSGYNDELTLMDGKVGLGVLEPKEKLDMVGNIYLRNMRNAIGAGTSVSFSSYDNNSPGPKISSYLDYAEGANSRSRLILSSYSSGYKNELTLMEGNVGVGVLEPKEKLDMAGNIYLRNMRNAIGAGTSVLFSSYDNNSPGPKISSYMDYAEGANSRSRLILSSYSKGYKNELTLMDGNVGIGTISPTEKLSVNGNISAAEINVEVRNWPDYVFSKKYELPGLPEIEGYIARNGHLPGMPSAAEAETNGISLGDMNAKLLRKIEELTLHLIILEKSNKKQQLQIDALKLKK